jgi:acyl carrier protein
VITQDDFIRIVRDQLRLPLANADLESDFDQVVSWRSIHLVRLFVALEKHTGRRVPVARLFEERTVRGVYSLFAEGVAAPEVERRGLRT